MKPILVGDYKGQDPTGWWISEKFDGVRAIWTGSELLTKSGKKLDAPAWFTSELPQDPLDGELWLGRGNFQTLAGLVRRNGDNWDGVIYKVFDTPNSDPWEQRQDKIQGQALPNHVEIVTQTCCLSESHLWGEFHSVVNHGGEGVVIRAAESDYVPGSRKETLKVVPVDSNEAFITGYTEGKGQFLGCVGALIVEFNGVQFKLGAGLTRPLRETPPPLGSIITFNYKGTTTKGVPRQPTFVAVRDYE